MRFFRMKVVDTVMYVDLRTSMSLFSFELQRFDLLYTSSRPQIIKCKLKTTEFSFKNILKDNRGVTFRFDRAAYNSRIFVISYLDMLLISTLGSLIDDCYLMYFLRNRCSFYWRIVVSSKRFCDDL